MTGGGSKVEQSIAFCTPSQEKEVSPWGKLFSIALSDNPPISPQALYKPNVRALFLKFQDIQDAGTWHQTSDNIIHIIAKGLL